jgi:hypothetical protein
MATPSSRPRRSGGRSESRTWKQLRRTSLIASFLSREALMLAAEAAESTENLRRAIAEKCRVRPRRTGVP